MSQKRRKRRGRHVRWGRIAVLFAGVLFIFWAAYNIYLFFSPLQLHGDDITVEYKSKYDPRDNIKTAYLGSKDQVAIDGSVDTGQLGDYELIYKYKGKEKKATVHVTDTTAPEMEVKDIMADMTQQLVPEDFVASSSDQDTITYAFKDEQDTSKKGKYDVIIVASDPSGNKTEKTARLDRVEDTTKPKLESSSKELKVLQGTEIPMDTFKATDDMDPAPTVSYDSSTVDLTKEGTYEMTVVAADRSGNQTSLKQKVQIEKNPEYNAKVVYLTFDDGPSENTKKIIDILKQNNATATFFVTGNHPEFNKYIKEAYDNGNTIGLHTYTHDYASVYASVDSYFDDLQKISDMVEGITGEKSKYIRFPGGSSNTVSANYTQGIMSQLVDLVHERGYEFYDWNVSSGDASGNNVAVDTLYQGSTACEAQYCTILFHDTDAKNTTVEVLPKVIDYYRKKGYVFLGLGPNSVAEHHGVNN